ncbi:MAG: hypothetical protein PVG39_07875 [Desulfobacteraceae bacterium]|jgi:calcineurin-like phosphoesterase family protein
MNYYTADWHLFHRNIIKLCHRPFKNEARMHRTLVRNYNEVVGEDDTCYVIGDVAMIGNSQWERLGAVIKKLNGTKHLILGNHDQLKWERYIDVGFTSVHSALWFDEDNLKIVLAHDPCVYCAIESPLTILICGHVHTLFKSIPERRVVNVGVDMWDFKPVSTKQIRKELNV